MSGKIGKSDRAQKCSLGIHDIAVGQDNYYDKVNEKWIRCTDLECFKKQGGTYDPTVKQGKPSRSKETRLADAIQMLTFLWPVAVKKAQEAYPYPDTNGATIGDANAYAAAIQKIDYERKILAQVFLKVMTEEYTR